MNAKLFAVLLLEVMSLISSNPVSNGDTCIFKDEGKVPTFLHHLIGVRFIEIKCSKDMCHCDSNNTGYRGCQSCCCVMREKHEGNKKTRKILIDDSIFLVKMKTLNLRFYWKSSSWRVFSRECCELFQNNYFSKHLWRASSASLSTFPLLSMLFITLIISINPTDIYFTETATRAVL